MNNKYEYKLLREEVASQDAFSQKTHEHIADSIVSLIENEKGGTTIGLEGSWGSGKSTVISLMTSKLSDAKVFIFDAWAHEGDCLRRIFLESILEFFIKKLNSAELHGDIAWFQKKVETISKRKQVVDLITAKSGWQAATEYKRIIEDALLIWYNDADDHTKQDLKFVADKFKITIPEEKSKKEKG